MSISTATPRKATSQPLGVGDTANSAISSISAISVQKAQAQTKDWPMQESQKPQAGYKEARSCYDFLSRNDGIFSPFVVTPVGLGVCPYYGTDGRGKARP
jgi:hypothetical protein